MKCWMHCICNQQIGIYEIGGIDIIMWNELGISGGTAIVILIALYFVIKWAVKNGMKAVSYTHLSMAWIR